MRLALVLFLILPLGAQRLPGSQLSTDGRFMAFQTAKTTDPAGVGYGIVVMWFKK